MKRGNITSGWIKGTYPEHLAGALGLPGWEELVTWSRSER